MKLNSLQFFRFNAVIFKPKARALNIFQNCRNTNIVKKSESSYGISLVATEGLEALKAKRFVRLVTS